MILLYRSFLLCKIAKVTSKMQCCANAFNGIVKPWALKEGKFSIENSLLGIEKAKNDD